jgi:hypothetical protein
MNIALFLIVLVVSFITVRIGAIAFQMTGLEWSMAKFQALSCFTSTGFTTSESEQVTSNPRRRRIASILIVLGHAGFVTMIATLANSIRAQTAIERGLSKSILPFNLPPYLIQIINLVIIVGGIYIIFKLFSNTIIVHKLTVMLRKKVIKRQMLKTISSEELLLATGGYGVSTVRLRPGHPVTGKTLLESGLRKEDINILAVVRGNETMPNPKSSVEIREGDELICFGKLDHIREEFA